jgi:hypothetical protein
MRNETDIAIDILFMNHKIKNGDVEGFLSDWKINAAKFMEYNSEGKYVVKESLPFIIKYSIGGLLFDALNKFINADIKKEYINNLNNFMSRINIEDILSEVKKDGN